MGKLYRTDTSTFLALSSQRKKDVAQKLDSIWLWQRLQWHSCPKTGLIEAKLKQLRYDWFGHSFFLLLPIQLWIMHIYKCKLQKRSKDQCFRTVVLVEDVKDQRNYEKNKWKCAQGDCCGKRLLGLINCQTLSNVGETKRSVGEYIKEDTTKIANNLSAVVEH